MLNNKKIIISCSMPGSLINFRGRLIEELVKNNNEVTVFVPSITDTQVRNKLQAMGVTIYENSLIRNSIAIWNDFAYILQLRRLIKKIKPDIFFAYTFKPVIFGSLLASLYNVKGIVAMLTGLGYSFTEENKGNMISKITRYLLKLSLKSKQLKIILQNRDDYHELLSLNIIKPQSKAYVVNGSGVDLQTYHYVEPPSATPINFLMMSRLINAKGVQEYYEAAKIVKQKYPHVSFTLIGSRDEGSDSISEVLFQKIKSDHTLQYLGWSSDVKPFIQTASVVVLPSYYREGVPRSIQEGMAMGRAVITTNHIGCKETINPDLENQNGLLVPIKNSYLLASAMEYYIKNPQEILRHGKNGRKYALKKFDVNQINKNMLEILEP